MSIKTRRPWMAGWLLALASCGVVPSRSLPNEATQPVDKDRYELLARLVHISDAQIVDEESPGRLAALAGLNSSAWRPQEAYTTQLLDGTIRAINRLHVAEHTVDFVIHTGDAADNTQRNELDWFITALDGGVIDPRTGPDDRDENDMPDPLMDPHEPFAAQGLYQHGIHGDEPTIPWFAVPGNHDRFASGVFPIVADLFGRRTSPLPLENRVGIFLPLALNPTGSVSWAPITPASQGPPTGISFPRSIAPNASRRFLTKREFVETHIASKTLPLGHGFDPAHPERSWYSVSPVPGLRLIGLDSATPLFVQPGLVFSEGAISHAQRTFLRSELAKAEENGELVIVATHHPSADLEPVYGTSLTTRTLRELLSAYPCVKLHLAGHNHVPYVLDHGSYVEIVTGAIVDAPQEGRVIEIWKQLSSEEGRSNPTTDGAETDPAISPTLDGEVVLRYWMFSHLDDPPSTTGAEIELFADPLLPMRRVAADLAGVR